jgi:adenine phosphoribosyltransferase
VTGREPETPVTGRPLADPAIAALISGLTVEVPDFPEPGVSFKDLTPLFADGPAFKQVVDTMAGAFGPAGSTYDVVAGIEARGFVLAAAIAYATGAGMVPIRKAGKLPRPTLGASYALEYGRAEIEIHADALEHGARVLVVDDVLATGGTAEAALGLVERAGGVVAGFVVLMELSFLDGRDRLAGRPLHALLIV